ncbi:hypothetical protein, partial [Clavibacter michiganensis]|uniref:hypothetical protein n=1 Tax=Clavibacter michiganensis TaxID=28447 RepID=UPI0019D3ADC9
SIPHRGVLPPRQRPVSGSSADHAGPDRMARFEETGGGTTGMAPTPAPGRTDERSLVSSSHRNP